MCLGKIHSGMYCFSDCNPELPIHPEKHQPHHPLNQNDLAPYRGPWDSTFGKDVPRLFHVCRDRWIKVVQLIPDLRHSLFITFMMYIGLMMSVLPNLNIEKYGSDIHYAKVQAENSVRV